MITFVVPGNPIPKERPRVVKGHTYTPNRTLKAEAVIALAARLAGARPGTNPVKLTARFFRATAQRCDVDNLIKTVLDGLNGIAFADDSQIVMLIAHKGIDRENPRTEIEVSDVPNFTPCDWDRVIDDA